jgi:hypothetical protein
MSQNDQGSETLDYLPLQSDAEIALYSTEKEVVDGTIGADEYREGLVKLKSKFISEVKMWSEKFALNADIRVYFTLSETPEEQP